MSLASLRMRLAWPLRRSDPGSGDAVHEAAPVNGTQAAAADVPARLAALREYFSYHGAWAPGVRLLRLLNIRDKMTLLAALLLVPALVLAWFAMQQQTAVADAAAHRLAGLRLVAAASAMRVELGARAAAEESGRPYGGDKRADAYRHLLQTFEEALALDLPLQQAWERARVAVERAIGAPESSPETQASANATALLALESFKDDVVALAYVTGSEDPLRHAQSELAVNDLPPLQTSLALLRRGLERLADSESSIYAHTRRAALVDAAAAWAVVAERHAAAERRLQTVLHARGQESAGLAEVRAYMAVARKQLLAWSPAALAAPLPPLAPGAAGQGAAGPGPAPAVSGLDRTLLRSAYAVAREQVHALRLSETKLLHAVLEQVRDEAVVQRNALVAALALGLLLTLYLMYSFYLVMRGGLDQLNVQIARMANGDLSSRVMPLGVDEVATALRGMTLSLEHLSDLVASVTQGVGGVKHAAEQVATGNAELSSRNHQTAQGMVAVVDGVARYAVQLEACGRQVEQVVENVQALRLESARNRKQMLRLRERMVALRNKSREIGEVVTLIDNIAFRTNILALNASVEASKAGEAGRGFAVVALEVRALANRGAESAHRIGDIIRRSTEDIEMSHALVEETGNAMSQADRQVDQIHSAVDSVASLTRAGEKESSELLAQLTEIKRASADTLNLVEQVANASDAMRSQGQRLAYKLGRFKLS